MLANVKQCLHVLDCMTTVSLVMANTRKLSPMFRLWEENLKALEPVAKLGLNCSEVVNEALKEALKPHVDKKLKSLKAALAEV
jgi:phage-related holin